jgi:hypothetical protein
MDNDPDRLGRRAKLLGIRPLAAVANGCLSPELARGLFQKHWSCGQVVLDASNGKAT